MSFILWDKNERYRKRAWGRLFRLAFLAGCIFLAARYAFQLGHDKAESEIQSYQTQIDTLNKRIEQSQQRSTNVQASCQTIHAEYQQLRTAYENEQPDERLIPLIDMLEKQIESGLDPERLAFLIRSAQPPHNCSQPETKRFVLSTPLYQGPDSFVGFGNNTVTINGTGQPATNENGEPEAWFDPGKPVTIRFTKIGGKTEKKTGLLPLHHTIVVGQHEYRFTITVGPQSFILITADNCDYIY